VTAEYELENEVGIWHYFKVIFLSLLQVPRKRWRLYDTSSLWIQFSYLI